MKMRSSKSAPSSPVYNVIAAPAQPRSPALYGAWAVDLTTGNVWWSEEIEGLWSVRNAVSQGMAVSDCRQRLADWAKSISSKMTIPEDRYQLDVLISAGEDTSTISFLCFANIQSEPITRLTGIAFRKNSHATSAIATPIGSLRRKQEINTFRQFALEAAEIGIWEWDVVRGEATHIENCLELLGLGV
ncbi:hypothetical protein [Rhizobium sp. CCGE 510]|uniref:hypothetical protein n=1 Tax=Rhizobium sp. CCGE 510 TaxID=1132836 RepID=UPI00027B873C|nr:hypothetical protein [Rhizobium sp. CCGE 510]EJT02263.1 hypothetical protein RCCGE510_27221 [Rhizobium sp. CCGE 510]